LYYNLLLCFIPLEMHARLICAIKFYLVTYLLTVSRGAARSSSGSVAIRYLLPVCE